jgi:hypothetical protein
VKLRTLLTLAAIYMGILGVSFIIVPRAIGAGAVPDDASAALIAYLRILGSPFLGIAALDWTARNLPPSRAHRTIILANLVGFGVAALLDVWGLFSGARQLAKAFVIVHMLFAMAFIRARMNLSREAAETCP